MKNLFVIIAVVLFATVGYSQSVDFNQLKDDEATFETWYDAYGDGTMIDHGTDLDTYVGGIFINYVTVDTVRTHLDEDIITFCGDIYTDWTWEYDYDGIYEINDQVTVDRQIGILFDLFHLGSLRSDWRNGATVEGTAYTKEDYYISFQLAIWEINFEDDNSLTDNTGNFYYSDGLVSDNMALGDYMLEQVQASYDNGDNYSSEVFRVTGLVAGGLPNQTLLVASNVPEPFTLGLFGWVGFIGLWIRKRFSD